MAASKQALRTRIKSVNSTRKITKAMEMIANAKLVKQRNAMEANRQYAQRLQDTVDEIIANNPGVECSYLEPKTTEAKVTIMFCSDLGLCGGYNQNVVKLAREKLDKNDPVILVGTSLYRQLREEGFNLINEYPISSDRMTFLELKDLVDDGINLYRDNKVGTVELLYTRFVNTMSFVPEIDQLLPFNATQKEMPEKTGDYVETLFEPDAQTILDHLIPMMIHDVVYADWMESTTAEQGSRRVAMKTATDNADELSASLKLEYNKARQAAITQEITEIVGGSAAV